MYNNNINKKGNIDRIKLKLKKIINILRIGLRYLQFAILTYIISF